MGAKTKFTCLGFVLATAALNLLYTSDSLAQPMRTFTNLLLQIKEDPSVRENFAELNDNSYAGIWLKPKQINLSEEDLIPKFKEQLCYRLAATRVLPDTPDLNNDGFFDLIVLYDCGAQQVLEGVFTKTGSPVTFERGDTLVKLLCGSEAGLYDCTRALTGDDVLSPAGDRPGWVGSVFIQDLNADGILDIIFPQQTDSGGGVPDISEFDDDTIQTILSFCDDYWATDWFTTASLESSSRMISCWYSASDTYILSNGSSYDLVQFPQEIPVWTQSFVLQEINARTYAVLSALEGTFVYRFDDDAFVLVGDDGSPALLSQFSKLRFTERFSVQDRQFILGFPSIKDPSIQPECALTEEDSLDRSCYSDGFAVFEIFDDRLQFVANWDARVEEEFEWGEFEMLIWPSGEKLVSGGYCNNNAPCSAFKYRGLWNYGSEASPYLFGYGHVLKPRQTESIVEIAITGQAWGPWGDFMETFTLNDFMYVGCESVSDECAVTGRDLRKKSLLLRFSFDVDSETLSFEGNLTSSKFIPYITGVKRSGDLNSDGYPDIVVDTQDSAYEILFLSDASGQLNRVAAQATLPYRTDSQNTEATQYLDVTGDGKVDYLKLRNIRGNSVLETFEARQNPMWEMPTRSFEELIDLYTACATDQPSDLPACDF